MEKTNIIQIIQKKLKYKKRKNLLQSFVLILLFLVFIYQPISAQVDKTFTFQYVNANLKTILNEIEKSSEYKFMYSQEVVDVQRKVSITVKNANISTVLDKLFSNTKLNYKVSGNQVAISTIAISKSQNIRKVSGTILDVLGVPLPGVNVIEKGTSNGTISDLEGRYEIDIAGNTSMLSFSYIGFLTENMPVGNQTVIDLILLEDIQNIDEVVVIGYGTSKKSDLTGSVISITKDRLENLPSTNILESMQGSVAGVTITNGNARPGSEPEIYIRGINSITADNAPLIVVDGVPGTGLANINQNDIESIEILKDASASAIYGARGANGVILVTTKRGKGKAKVSYNGYAGIQQISNTLDLMDGSTHIANKIKAYELGGFPSDTSDIYTIEEYANIIRGAETDWQDVYLREAKVQEHQISVSAGLEKTNYYLSLSYTDHDHILQNFNFKRLGLRFNVDQKIGNWLNIGNSLNLTQSKQSGVSGNLKNATLMSPWNNPYDDEGELILYPANNNFIGNPLAERRIIVDDNKYQIFNNLFGVINLPVKGMTYRINLGTDIRNFKNNKYQGRDTPLGYNANGIADIANGLTKNWLWENIFNYEYSFKEKHNLKFTGLYSSQEFYRETSAVNAFGFPTDQIIFNNLSAAESYNAPSSSAIKSTYVSLMGRLSYDYIGKYYLTGTVRKDGYSAFGANKKYGTFPSMAFSWRISQEDFLESSNLISNLKLRLSFGKNGNQAVEPYSSIANVVTGNPDEPENGGNSYAYIFGQTIDYGYLVSKLGNEDLGWETTESFNMAVDYGFFNGRISGALEYYNSNTSNLLLDRGISWVNGYSEVRSNIGQTHNHGIEFTINTFNFNPRGSNFQWNTNFNVTYNKNEIVDLYGNGLNDIGNEWFIGQPISVVYDYVFDGIVQEDEDMSETAQPSALPGEIKVKDINNNGIIDPEDRQIIGYGRPDYTFGITNTFSYRGFELNIFIHGISGVTKQNSILDNSQSAGNNNLDVDWWTPESASNIYPTLKQGKVTSYWSSFQYQNANYIRVRDISFGYDFPKKVLTKMHFERLRLYVSGRNLFTFTEWSGLDPETGSFKNPNTKSVTVGINLTL